jgi:hypothetical protein
VKTLALLLAVSLAFVAGCSDEPEGVDCVPRPNPADPLDPASPFYVGNPASPLNPFAN